MKRKDSRSSASGKEHERQSPAVADYMAGLAHPFKSELLAVRKIILSAGGDIEEGIKWNAPSFWCGEWFASFHLRAKEGLLLVLHRGAKAKTPPGGTFVEDPERMLSWIERDRCTITFSDAADVKKKADALRAIIREWSRKVAGESTNAK